MLSAACCLLPAVCYLLPVVCCLLPAACCLLSAVCCLLPVCCLLCATPAAAGRLCRSVGSVCSVYFACSSCRSGAVGVLATVLPGSQRYSLPLLTHRSSAHLMTVISNVIVDTGHHQTGPSRGRPGFCLSRRFLAVGHCALGV